MSDEKGYSGKSEAEYAAISLGKGSTFLFFGRFLFYLIGFIGFAIVARLIVSFYGNAEPLGWIYVAATIPSLISILGDFGVGYGITNKFIVNIRRNEKDKAMQYFWTGVFYSLFLNSLYSIAAFFLGYYIIIYIFQKPEVLFLLPIYSSGIMAILVTGAGGFIGSHVSEYLAKQGFDIIGIDNLSRKNILKREGINELYNWNYLNKFKNIELIKGDITRKGEIESLFKKEIDAIIHTAAQVAVTTSLENPELDLVTNIIGTFNILEIARKKDAKIIFTSTNKVYGENVNKLKLIENEKRYEFADEKYKKGIPEEFPIDLTSHTPYGCSKLASDIYVQDYFYTYGLSTFCLRMSCIYGIRQFGVEDQGWVAWFAIATLTNKQINIYGNGKQVRDILYVEDLCNLISKIIDSKIKHAVYNIGGGPSNSISLLELLDLLERITGRRANVKFFDWRKSDQYVYISDITKAKRELNWEPKISFEEGIKRLINWIKENINLFQS